MIQQLILSTLFACSNKNSEVSKDIVPPTPPETVTPDLPTKDLSPSLEEEVFAPIIGSSDPQALLAPQEFRGGILVEHIQKIQESNQEVECTLLCQQSLLSSPFAQGSYIIDSCSEERVENWQELLEQGDSKTSLGEVKCAISPKKRPRVIKGRAPMSCTNGFIPAEDLATYFARQAQEEALSIFSFAELHQILQHARAPKDLLNRCLKALKEEQSHTRIAISLCEQYGGPPPKIEVPKPTSSTIFEAALHNALVGCIQETWAALLETYQAKHTSIHKRLQMRIATDEIAHAQLAWDIHHFFMTLLSSQERTVITDSMSALLACNNIDLVEAFPSSIDIGIPTEDMQQHLYTEFAKRIQHRIRQVA